MQLFRSAPKVIEIEIQSGDQKEHVTRVARNTEYSK